MAYNTDDIVNYLNGRMSTAETAAFELAMSTDTALAEEVEHQRKLSRLVQIATLKNRLDTIQEEFTGAGTTVVPIKPRNSSKKWIWMAAAAIIVGIGLFLMFYQSPYDRVFNTWFRDDPGSPSLMGSNEATPYDRAMVYYKSGDYEAAAQGFKQIIVANSKNDSAKYYEALSLIRLKKETEALPLLSVVSASGDREMSNRAMWYQALVLIHQKKTIEASRLLQTLVGSWSDYAGKATDVLTELRNKKLIN